MRNFFVIWGSIFRQLGRRKVESGTSTPKTQPKEIMMMNKLLLLASVLFVLGIGSFVVISSASEKREPTEKQFALLMKATGPEFFKKTQEPDGMRLVDKHFKKLQALTAQGVCIFSGHSLNHDESGFGIIVVRAESEAAAQKIIDDDDLVKAGLVRGTIFPFQVVTSGK
jgi:uncharacterized protein YciI